VIESTQTSSRGAWVTGASSGIGWHLSLKLAQAGWRVAASARREQQLRELAAASPEGAVRAFAVDVTDAVAVRVTYDAIRDAHGAPDLCVFNAGVYEPAPITDFDLKRFRTHVEVNIMGVAHGVAAVLPDMIARRRGQIIINASVAGYRGLPNGVPYGVTKAALINLAETMRAELSPKGVRVRVINPGFVKTSLTDKNKFKMPALIEPQDAAMRIMRELDGSNFEITFPRRFTYVMKCLRCLPYRLYFPLVRRLV